MDRRETLKSLFVGSIAGGIALTGCTPEELAEQQVVSDAGKGYGRTPAEKAIDEKLKSDIFLTEHEIETVAILCDIILPAKESAGSAGDAGVPDFIDFIVKDLPQHQLPIRGGLMWLDHRSNKQFDLEFKKCSNDQQISIIEDIAYPETADPSLIQGVKFFTLMRNLTLTGYYTTKMGFEDLGYVGNTPNVWDGVPEDVLKKHNMEYEKEWLAKCIDQDTRGDIASWDDEGNLIS